MEQSSFATFVLGWSLVGNQPQRTKGSLCWFFTNAVATDDAELDVMSAVRDCMHALTKDKVHRGSEASEASAFEKVKRLFRPRDRLCFDVIKTRISRSFL